MANSGKRGWRMTRVPGPWSSGVREMLAQERRIPAVPASTRDRALARALEAMTTIAVSRPIEPRPVRKFRWVVFVPVLGLASAAGGVAVYSAGVYMQAVPAAAAVARQVPQSAADGETRATAAAVPRLEVTAVSPLVRHARSPADGEVRLLEQARAALERADFAAAMIPLAEHARRFNNGQLAEEREALRVRALSGLGLRDEVRRAAADFEARFPRSPLLPTVNRLASSS